jgi:hypothetical protein
MLTNVEWWTHAILDAFSASLDASVLEDGRFRPLESTAQASGECRRQNIQISAILAKIHYTSGKQNPEYRLVFPSTVILSLPMVIIARLTSSLMNKSSIKIFDKAASVVLKSACNPAGAPASAAIYVEAVRQDNPAGAGILGLHVQKPGVRTATTRRLMEGLARHPYLLHLFVPIRVDQGWLQGKITVEWTPAYGISQVDALPRFLMPMASFSSDTLSQTRNRLREVLSHTDIHAFWKLLAMKPSPATPLPRAAEEVQQNIDHQFSPADIAALTRAVEQVATATEYFPAINKLTGKITAKYTAPAIPASNHKLPQQTRQVRQRTDTTDSWHSQWHDWNWQSGWDDGGQASSSHSWN